MEKIITPLKIPGPFISAVPPWGGNYFARRGIKPSYAFDLFRYYLISSVLKLKESHEFEYIKNQVLTTLGDIGSARLEVLYKKKHKIQHSVNIAKFWLSFLNLDYLIKENCIENRKKVAITAPLLRNPLFRIFTLMEEYKTDTNSGENSAEVGLVGATNTTILRLSAKSGYFPVIEIQNLLNPLDTVLIKNEKDWEELIDEPNSQSDIDAINLFEHLSSFHEGNLKLTAVSGKRENIELDEDLLTEINNYLNNWTRIGYGKEHRGSCESRIFEHLTQILGAIEPRYALVTNNNNINLIKYE